MTKAEVVRHNDYYSLGQLRTNDQFMPIIRKKENKDIS
jgi:hypothetical protein